MNKYRIVSEQDSYGKTFFFAERFEPSFVNKWCYVSDTVANSAEEAERLLNSALKIIPKTIIKELEL